MRIIADVSYQHNQLDDLIASEFIPEINGGIHCSTIERKLLSIPSQLGGIEFQSSLRFQIKNTNTP